MGNINEKKDPFEILKDISEVLSKYGIKINSVAVSNGGRVKIVFFGGPLTLPEFLC
jgi:predicted regulator of amino acid metabolism with ACT domain